MHTYFFLRDLDNDDDSDDEKGSDDKGLELSSDSELSQGDEPLMEIQVSSDRIIHIYVFNKEKTFHSK